MNRRASFETVSGVAVAVLKREQGVVRGCRNVRGNICEWGPRQFGGQYTCALDFLSRSFNLNIRDYCRFPGPVSSFLTLNVFSTDNSPQMRSLKL